MQLQTVWLHTSSEPVGSLWDFSESGIMSAEGIVFRAVLLL